MIPIAAIVPAIRANIGMVLNVLIAVGMFTAGYSAARYIYLIRIEKIESDHVKEQTDRQNAVIAAQNAIIEAQRKAKEEKENAHQVIDNLMRNADRDIAVVTGRMRVRAIQRICSDTLPTSGVQAASPSGDLLDAYFASVEEVRRESVEAVRQCEIDRF